ncbi:MAG TPA: choice-of-anchor tandem repeat NxxGxxAF-containing protein [Chthoniobacteraceae bacterium]|nr:choice-of-anchor tandem repeat NxxGxxAF-containing protein [Chthoniobacteraceae bacterium]
MVTTPLRRWILSSAGACCLLASSSFAEIEFETVARIGQPAAGVGGPFTFSSFRGHVLGPSGLVAFRAWTSGGNAPEGIWAGYSAPVGIVAQEYQPAPGAGGTSYNEFDVPLINVANEIIYQASISPVTNGATGGLWFQQNGSATYLPVGGQQAPGNGVGDNFTNIYKIVTAGTSAAFIARVAGPGISFGVNDEGIWAGRPGSLTLVAQQGDPAPGTTLNYGDLSYLQGNYTGTLAFNANLGPFSTGIFAGAPGSVTAVVQENDPVFALPNVSYDQFSAVALAPNSSRLAFASRIKGTGVTGLNGTAIFAGLPGSFSMVTRQGDAAPGTEPGVLFGSFMVNLISSAPHVADDGQVTFLAPLTGPTVDATNDMGVWAGLSGSLKLVAREGFEVPGVPANLVFDTLDKPFMNPLGQIAFHATLGGPGLDSTNDRGLWATDLAGDLLLVARTGDTIDLGGGQIKTISGLALNSWTADNDGTQRIFNANGQLLFAASFTDGSGGLFVAAIPEPTSAVTLSVLIAWLSTRRRRLS